MDKIFSLVASAAAIAFILWWFFGQRSETSVSAEEIDGVQQVTVTVDGGYQPQVVQLAAGQPARIVFDRKDPSACLEEISMPDFGVARGLELGKQTAIDIPAQAAGTYKYTCGMQMFSGKVVVK